MIGKFEFNHILSSDFGIYISGSGTFNSPERDMESISIPGKNGDLIIDNKRFKNIRVTYPAFIKEKFKDYTDVVRAWLLSDGSYHRLEDNYHPEEFRMARFAGPLDFDTRVLNRSGECSIEFDCKPQRFLKEGEIPIKIVGDMTIFNPTAFIALPKIRVYGTEGTLIVGNICMQINDIDEYVDIDCETQNAMKETTNKNSHISNTFPQLNPGNNGIRFEGNITKLEIIPRWWTL